MFNVIAGLKRIPHMLVITLPMKSKNSCMLSIQALSIQ